MIRINLNPKRNRKPINGEALKMKKGLLFGGSILALITGLGFVISALADNPTMAVDASRVTETIITHTYTFSISPADCERAMAAVK